ncbi:TolC family protein [Sphingomonas sp. MMS24-JH45]
MRKARWRPRRRPIARSSGVKAGMLSAEDGPGPDLPRTLADARGRRRRGNPVLLAQRRALDASAARIDLERAQGRPGLDLTGGYGRGVQFDRRDGGFPAAGNAGLTLRVPLLTGGLVGSRVRQAQAEWRAGSFDVDAAVREAARGIDAAWAALTAAGTRLDAGVRGLARRPPTSRCAACGPNMASGFARPSIC